MNSVVVRAPLFSAFNGIRVLKAVHIHNTKLYQKVIYNMKTCCGSFEYNEIIWIFSRFLAISQYRLLWSDIIDFKSYVLLLKYTSYLAGMNSKIAIGNHQIEGDYSVMINTWKNKFLHSIPEHWTISQPIWPIYRILLFLASKGNYQQ